MRTKTLALSALLSVISSASLVAQTNVYSLNAVGYINVTLAPGFNMVSCPLIATPDNTIGTILNNGGGGLPSSNQYLNWNVYSWNTGTASYAEDSANAKQANKSGYVNGWENGGTITCNPGQSIWVDNESGVPTTVTFVGTVPQNGMVNPSTSVGYLTNVLVPGFNMVGSAIPMSGDLAANTNTLLAGFPGNADATYFWDTSLSPASYDAASLYNTKHSSWQGGNPTTTNLTDGFWYDVAGGGNETWVENFSINP